MSELCRLRRSEGYGVCDDAEAEVYKAPVPPQRCALKPPRQLQPEVVHRLAFQPLCPFLAEMKMNRCADQRVPNIVRKAITVQTGYNLSS